MKCLMRLGQLLPLICWSLFGLGLLCLGSRAPMDLRERSLRYGRQALSRLTTSRPARQAFQLTARRRALQGEKELADSLAYILYVISLDQGSAVSRDLLLRDLAQVSPALSSLFYGMIHRLRFGEESAAEALFVGAFPLENARDIARLLTGWERLPPEELTVSFENHRDLLLSRRKTAQQKADEWISDLVYFPVVVNGMVILLNFITVAYWIGQREMLMGLL